MYESNIPVGKYTNHNSQQRMNLLIAAENLALEKGIHALTMKDIAEKSGVTRATLYRFFKTKEEILWEISSSINRDILELLSQFSGSTLERFQRYADVMIKSYLKDRRNILFLSVFFEEYERSCINEKINNMPNYYQTGSTVEFLCRNFFDGTVREDLDPVATAVSFSYGVIGILLFAAKAHNHIESRYALHSQEIAQNCIEALLSHIRP